MRLVDTSVWIEWLTGSRLGMVCDEKADRVIAFTESCVVAISGPSAFASTYQSSRSVSEPHS
jgi:hypothetical protein